MKTTLAWAQTIQSANGQTQPIFAVLFHSNDSQVIASLGNDIGLFDVETGELLKRLKGHKEPVTCVCSLANGGFASGGADKTVIIWSPKGEGVLKYTHSHSIQTLAQEPVSGILLSGTSGDFGLWSAAAKNVAKTKTPARVLSAGWSRDGQFFALGLANGIVSIRQKSGQERATIDLKSEAPVWGLSWTSLQGTDVLAVSDWSKRLAFYDVNGQQMGRERSLTLCPTMLQHSPTGDFFLLGGSDKKLSLWTSEGIRLVTVSTHDAWVWASRMNASQDLVVVGSQDGTVSLHRLKFQSVHGLYLDRYAYRETMTDVVIQHLTSDQRARIKCRDLVKKLSVYKTTLAVQLTDRILLYQLVPTENGDMQYTIKGKISKNLDCSFLVVTSQHVVLCQDKTLQTLNFAGNLEREWTLESSIRFLKVNGGPPGAEGLVVGLKSGTVAQVYLENPFPVTLLTQPNSIQCLDISLSRTRLALVDNQFTCLVYDLSTKELLFSEPNVTSVAWNSDFEEMLSYSTKSGDIHVRVSSFQTYSQKLSGFVVGFKGSRLFYLNNGTMSTHDVPQSTAMDLFIERKEFEAAYQVACLGVTQADWRRLAMAALENYDLPIAKKSFTRIQEVKFFDIIRGLEKAQAAGKSEEMCLLWAEANALNGSYDEAAKIYKKLGHVQKAVDMYSELNMWDKATELAKGTQTNLTDIIRKKAHALNEQNDYLSAVQSFVEIGDYMEAIRILSVNNRPDKLIELVRKLSKADQKELEACLTFFQKDPAHKTLATETLKKIGDMSRLLKVFVDGNQWDEAFALTELHPAIVQGLYLPYADWLASQDKFSEAQVYYRKAGQVQEAVRVLYQLASNAVLEGRFEDVSYYFYTLSTEKLDGLTSELKKGDSGKKDYSETVKEVKEYRRLAQVYYAYHHVKNYIEEPFSAHLPDSVFSMARYVYYTLIDKSLDKRPPGISMIITLYALSKLSQSLGAFKLARHCFERLLTLHLPTQWQQQVRINSLKIKARPNLDSEDTMRTCFSCGFQNPAFNLKGNSCTQCLEPFVQSGFSFHDLPLVQFQPAPEIPPEEVDRLLDMEPMLQSSSVIPSRIPPQKTKKTTSDAESAFQDELELLKKTSPESHASEDFEPIIFNHDVLLALDPATLFIQLHRGNPLLGRTFYRLAVSTSEAKLESCSDCESFFLEEEWIYQVLSTGHCPFCRAPKEIS